MFKRRYVAPVIMFDPATVTPLGQRLAVRLNLIVNQILPERLLRRLDARHNAKEYWQRIELRERKAREKLAKETSHGRLHSK